MFQGSVHHWGIQRDDIKANASLFNNVPCGFLCESLARKVCEAFEVVTGFGEVIIRDGVPISFDIDFVCVVSKAKCAYRSKTACDDDSLDIFSNSLDALEDFGGSLDSWVKKVGWVSCDLVEEWRSCV